jgi:putative ABC transport system permease protein
MSQMQNLFQDFRYALRLLFRNAFFSSLVITILALAIGMCTIAYSMVDVWLVRSLPFSKPQTLMAFWRTNPQNPGEPAYFTSWRDYQEWSQNSISLEDWVGFIWRRYNLKGNVPERVLTQVATPNLFPMLGVSAAYGRVFSSADANSNPIVLSYELWQKHFGGSKSILGQPVILDTKSYTVIGVMPKGFAIPSMAEPDPVDAWIPLSPDDQEFKENPTLPLAILARIRAGVSLKAAQTELAAITQRLDPSGYRPIWRVLSGPHSFCLWDRLV